MGATDPDAADLETIKRRQQEMWASGDYALVATHIVLVSELLAEAADLRAGSRVLDVATGSGNAAIAAARSVCDVVGLDYVPELLDRARTRAAAERLDVEFVEGDAERLPFPDESFDAVLSVFGVMFAPDQERAAGELVRVCRPGGTIALASWTPDGYVGRFFRATSARVPPPGIQSPLRWGSPDTLRTLLGDGVRIERANERTVTLRHTDSSAYVRYFGSNFGPLATAFAALDASGRAALEAELVALVEEFDRRREEGPIAVPAAYLEAVAVKR